MQARRTLRGALAGATAAGVWAAQQPLDKRVFGVAYDDCELLGTLITRGRYAYPVGVAMHIANGALFGAIYANVAPLLPGPRVARGLAAGLAEHAATWPGTRFMGLHPAADRFPPLWGSPAALAQATWRHALFGTVLGAAEARLNPIEELPPPVPEDDAVASNGHGPIERLAGVAG